MTTEFIAGRTMVMTWTYVIGTTAGTVSLAPDYRTFRFNETVDVKDGTAGSDVNKVKYLSFKDASIDVELVAQTGGTALNAALAAGVQGTLTVYPEGTASGKPLITFPSFSKGTSFDFPYDDVAKITTGWEANGQYTVS
jgi:hypothetical protein